MSTPQVIAILDAVAAGNEPLTRELASRSDVAITHLMLACKDLCDTTELARQCSKVTPANRKNVFVEALAQAAARNNSPIVQEVQDVSVVEAVQEQVEVPFEPDVQNVQASVPVEKPVRRRRSPSASTVVEDSPVVYQEVVQVVSQPLESNVNEQIDALNQALVSISHNFSKLLASNSEIVGRVEALDKGVSEDLKSFLTNQEHANRAQAEFRSASSDHNAHVSRSLDEISSKLDTLIQSVEKFRLGTEALEIELIAKGILESAPFADSWSNS